jgi:hypothetical protein
MISRRTVLKGLASCACLALPWRAISAEAEASRHAPWLGETQAPPAGAPTRLVRGAKLLVDENGRPIVDLDGWRERRETIAGKWRNFLGEIEAPPGPLSWKLIEEDSREGVLRQRIAYEASPGDLVEAYLLLPLQAKSKLPGVVVHHSTVDYSIRQPAGLEGPAEDHFGLKLAQRGFVALCPRNYLWPTNDSLQAAERAAEFLARQPRAKGMANMLFHSQLAVDLLSSLPNVDAERIGVVGHSLGAKESLYLAAFDQRIKAAVSSEGGEGVGFSNWHDAWYLGPEAATSDFPLEHHELLALAAPRPFLLIGGEAADGDRGWPLVLAALEVWKLYGQPAPLAFYNHRRGHSVPPEAEKRIYEWLETYLGPLDRRG